jgi:hypothetical protein
MVDLDFWVRSLSPRNTLHVKKQNMTMTIQVQWNRSAVLISQATVERAWGEEAAGSVGRFRDYSSHLALFTGIERI